MAVRERAPGVDPGLAQEGPRQTADHPKDTAEAFHRAARWASTSRRPSLLAALVTEWLEHRRGAA